MISVGNWWNDGADAVEEEHGVHEMSSTARGEAMRFRNCTMVMVVLGVFCVIRQPDDERYLCFMSKYMSSLLTTCFEEILIMLSPGPLWGVPRWNRRLAGCWVPLQ